MVFPGNKLFELKATHGMPLEAAVDRIMNVENLRVDWLGFLEEARQNGWWDFQTLDVIKVALEDAGVTPMLREGIVTHLKHYIAEHPLVGRNSHVS